MTKLRLYALSTDRESWTNQWLTEAEAKEHEEMGYIVEPLEKRLHEEV